VSGGTGALLVSLFKVEWGCYAQAGVVEESEKSEFCLFSVVFSAKCFSSISPRFYFKKHAVCFLPLVTILESPDFFFQLFVTFLVEVIHILCLFLGI
jgi:hypothetical protein